MSARAVRSLALPAALVVLVVLSLCAAAAQEPILTFSVDPDHATIAAGGRLEVRIVVENRSTFEADDVEIVWGDAAVVPAEEPAPIERVDPFATDAIRLVLEASPDAAEGERPVAFEVVYSYCVGDVCYQIVEAVDFAIAVVPPTDPTVVEEVPPTDVVEVPERATPFPWPWVGLGVALIAAGCALLAGRRTGRRGVAAAALGLVLAGALAYGVARNQHEQAQGIGAVLCTSCVGIEEARSVHEARFSPAGVDALRALDVDVELTVFYAEWCHSCPYAEAMVERAAEVTDRIAYTFVDVEVDPALAAERGVIRSGRTVVPAIVRAGADEVLFGVEDLERRLLELLGVGR